MPVSGLIPNKSTEVFSIDPVHFVGHFNPRAFSSNEESLFSLTASKILIIEMSDGFETYLVSRYVQRL